MANLIEKTISHYKIVEHVGEGGMGVVYRAQDTRLLRPVAIKILPEHLVADKKNRQRFIHEARAVSALNHPNICTLHDIGEKNGIQFIVMEFVEGQTLGDILTERGPLPETEVIEIGIKVCDALSAAHDKGIIHRDMKPDNIMITHDGRVKVMDFGLAKLLHSDHEQLYSSVLKEKFFSSQNLLKTSMSTFQGTASYMAPEQIEKKRIDARTDIFAIGVVLYELLTGIPPFVGKDSVAVMKSIMQDEPAPPNRIRKEIAPRMNDIVLKALAKVPHKRFNDMTKLGEALKAIGQSTKTLQTKKSIFRRYLFGAGILILALSMVAYLRFFVFSDHTISTEQGLKIYPLAITDNIEQLPAFSPDGKQLIYASSRSNSPLSLNGMIIRDIESSSVNVFKSAERIAVEFNGNYPDWSPNGNYIAFSRSNLGIYIYNMTQKSVQQLSNFGLRPKWSPDGNEIVFQTNDVNNVGSKSDIYILELKNQILHRLSPDTGKKYVFPCWSPDGRWIICTVGEGSKWEIWCIDRYSGHERQLTELSSWIQYPVWSKDGKKIYFSSNKGGKYDLWSVAIDIGSAELLSEPGQITFGQGIIDFNLSPQGERLVFLKGATNYEIWRLSLAELNSEQLWNQAERITGDLHGIENIEISLDGHRLVIEANDNGNRFLQILDLTDNNKSILYDKQPAFAPTWSADGHWIAFDAGGGNEADIWRIPNTGGQAEKLIENPGADWMPNYSPDDKYLSFISNRSGDFDLWLFNLHTQGVLQITYSSERESRGAWSPDGSKLAFLQESATKGLHDLWIYDILNSKKYRLIQVKYGTADIVFFDKLIWRADSKTIYFFNHQHSSLAEVSIATKEVRDIIVEEENVFHAGLFTILGNNFYFVRGADLSSDIWIAEWLK